MTMILSDNGLKFIKNHEGRYLYWYELNDGGLTCGYGHWVPHATAAKMGIKKAIKSHKSKQMITYVRTFKSLSITLMPSLKRIALPISLTNINLTHWSATVSIVVQVTAQELMGYASFLKTLKPL